MEAEKKVGSGDPEQSRFDMARSFIAISGVPQEKWETIFRVAHARALYLVKQTNEGKAAEEYPGEFPGIVNVATESILLELSAEN